LKCFKEMDKRNYYYLELRNGEKVIKRKPTSLASEYRDRSHLELSKEPDHDIFFVASSAKEKTIL